jgi:hypothetical protein
MESRQTIDEQIYIHILPGNDYKKEVMGSDFKKVEGILDTDRVIGFGWKTWQDRHFMSMDDEGEKTFYAPCIIVLRKRPETDDEYFKRMKEDEQRKKDINERERLEYLRLKAKFENEELGT